MLFSKEYLNTLIDELDEIKKNANFQKLNKDVYSISFLPTKKQAFIGLKSGFAEKILRLEKGIKEQVKIRSNCKDYLKIFRNEKQEIMQIEKYCNSKLDCIFQAYHFEELSYFIPYFKDGSFYPSYTFVTKIEDGKILSEYMINANQIIYEHYSNESDYTIDYYFINYVKNAKYPILEEKKGIIYKDSLQIKIEEYANWMNK